MQAFLRYIMSPPPLWRPSNYRSAYVPESIAPLSPPPPPPPRHMLSMPPVTDTTESCPQTVVMVLVSNGPILDLTMAPWYHGGGLYKNGNSSEAAARYISTLLKACHKLLYEIFGVFELVLLSYEKQIQLNQ